jgi:hypothetical protein
VVCCSFAGAAQRNGEVAQRIGAAEPDESDGMIDG